MQNQEVLNEVSELLNQAVDLMDKNEGVFEVGSLDVEEMYQVLQDFIYRIETRDEE